MLYSTCTYNRRENEENVQFICRELGAELVDPALPELAHFFSETPGMYRALPHRTMGEGFFIALLQKTAHAKPPRNPAKRCVLQAPTGKWPADLCVHEYEQVLYGLRDVNAGTLPELFENIPGIVNAGTPLGRYFHQDFKPNSALALLQGILSCDWPVQQWDDETVLQYLKRNSLPNPLQTKGQQLGVWQGLPIGFVNANRAQWNNGWPMEWRLRTDVPAAVSLLKE